MRKAFAAQTVAAAALAYALVAGCTAVQPEPGSAEAVQTVAMHDLVRSIDTYRGRTVRVCADELVPRTREDGSVVHWQLRAMNPSERFAARLILAQCGGERPQLENGCIVGRIAREDGSLEIPTTMLISDHVVMSEEWWLHPQCPPARR